MTENTPNEDIFELLKAFLVEAIEYLRIASEAGKKELGQQDEPDDDWSDDEDPWDLGSFCFLEEEDFGIMFGGVVFNAENEDSFDEEFQDEWE